MTRINLIDPRLLSDQHLFAEYREIKMIPKALERSIHARGLNGIRGNIPQQFTLNQGHVMFFYDKAKFLFNRFDLLRDELDERMIKYDLALSKLDETDVYGRCVDDAYFYKDYVPDSTAISIIKERIVSKIAEKPTWYRFHGKNNMLVYKDTLEQAERAAITKSYAYGVTFEVRKIEDNLFEVTMESWSDRGQVICTYRNGKRGLPNESL